MFVKHHITYDSINGVMYDLKSVTLTGQKEFVQLNCTTISIEALEHILKLHSSHFPLAKEVVLQLPVASNALSSNTDIAYKM